MSKDQNQERLKSKLKRDPYEKMSILSEMKMKRNKVRSQNEEIPNYKEIPMNLD